MTISLILLVMFVVALVPLWIKLRGHRIADPRLGMLDLSSGTACALVAEDRAALADLFATVEVSTDAVPKCDVLFLYAEMDEMNALVGPGRHFRATIRESGAKIVVVASENPNPNLNKPGPGDARANLVITLQRNGDKFTRFFRELFTRMKKGQTMPMAWIRLVPQVPGMKHENCPSTIFLMEAGPFRLG